MECILQSVRNIPEFFQIFWSNRKFFFLPLKMSILHFFIFFDFFQLNFLTSGLILEKKYIEAFFQEISHSLRWTRLLSLKMNPYQNYSAPKSRNKKKKESDQSFFSQKIFKRYLKTLSNVFWVWQVVLKHVRPLKK